MAIPARRQGRSLFPDLPEWFESFPSRLAWPAMADLYTVRIEEYPEGDRYLVRAEIPGIDPGKDLDITVQDGMLTIRAERTEETQEKHRSEFRYGSFTRTVALPAGAKEDDIQADYNAGILTVSVGLGEAKKEARRIKVTHTE
ncbi:Hsp20/alpha crystallin family protein [Peterkaempfera bronchialis]|uniref:Hsp20/alpha crystallin family protein n=1 Tax=Peterkaempfera bronchialis TaxID=2126346 RepID=A0A345SS51_9ACTN|nr:Hsp20/alpha crystallin family protein [Peterkaempfera bronchialis]AXI76556.1 Hsp20/alpha crystallin family protein [Peterkaempfera bronchialis]